MENQLLTETRISFNQLAQEQDVSLPTVWRWSTRGIKGFVLESLNVGGRKFTSREAFRRFIAATNGLPVPSLTNNRRAAELRRTKKALQAARMVN